MISESQFRLNVNPAYSAEDRVTLRYVGELGRGLIAPEELEPSVQKEGFRFLELGEYGGVKLFLLDETTRMKTGTYKSLDGCITTALCKKKGIQRAVFSSGANAGTALTDYGSRVGLETFFFCPTTTLHKLNGRLFHEPTAHLIAVEGPDQEVKKSAQQFAEYLDVPVIPLIDWRLLSSAFRGFYIAETMQQRRGGFSWFAQAVCAGYGPIGIYKTLYNLCQGGDLHTTWIPKFLGIQQAGLSPIVAAWAERCDALSSMASWKEASIEPALYNANPAQTYPMLREILTKAGGDMIAVLLAEFEIYAIEFLKLLENAGIQLTKSPENGEFIEKAGLLMGAGTLKAIKEGIIRKDESVLCSLTGGAGPSPNGTAVPDLLLASGAQHRAELQKYATAVCEKKSYAD